MKALWFFINFAVKQCPIAHKYRYTNFLFELYRAVDHLISAVRIVYSYLFVYALNNWRVTFFWHNVALVVMTMTYLTLVLGYLYIET